MMPEDDLEAARLQEESFQDERLNQYWDGERALGGLVSQTLHLHTPIAWDVYLIYSPGAAWGTEEMPEPDFWMHQLDERPDLLLDARMLEAEAGKALGLPAG